MSWTGALALVEFSKKCFGNKVIKNCLHINSIVYRFCAFRANELHLWFKRDTKIYVFSTDYRYYGIFFFKCEIKGNEIT